MQDAAGAGRCADGERCQAGGWRSQGGASALAATARASAAVVPGWSPAVPVAARRGRLGAALCAVLLVVAGCGGEPAEPKGGHAHEEKAAGPTNRIDIPPSVRTNLGMTFAKAERRAVARTLRVPGRFEYLPEARREYGASVAGRVEILVTRYAAVEKGTPLFRIESPRWREIQRELSETAAAQRLAEVAIESSESLRDAHRIHEESFAAQLKVQEERLAQLEKLSESGAGNAAQLAAARAAVLDVRASAADIAEKDVELLAAARRAATERDAAAARFALLLDQAASMTGIAAETLRAPSPDAGDGSPLWRTLARIDVRAEAPGIVESLGVTNGAFAAESAPIVVTLRPEMLTFRARAPQGDVARIKAGLRCRLVPLHGTAGASASAAGASASAAGAPASAAGAPASAAGVAISVAIDGELGLGFGADAAERTVELVVRPKGSAPWVRSGVAAHAEITLEAAGGADTSGGADEIAIPAAAVVRDGLRAIYFRRDPKNPDVAIRTDADTGVSDGRWITVLSGIREGDEVVVDGVYQLLLATAGTAQKGGHFHADGTFHDGED